MLKSKTTIFSLIFSLSICLSLFAQVPNNLKTESKDKPKGISEAKPKFSWQTKFTPKTGKQTGYQIIVASTEAGLKKNILSYATAKT